MYRLILIFFLSPFYLFSQNQVATQSIETPIRQLFEGMRNADAELVKEAVLPNITLQTSGYDREGNSTLTTTEFTEFLAHIRNAKPGDLDERIYHIKLEQDGNLATAWTPYSFYSKGTFSHCGTNAFHLIRAADGWRISHITDTRRKQDCPDPAIQKMLDGWHKAAATADEEAFFGAMTSDAIYLGTDASERWLRDELRTWSKAAFERETAWAFTPSNRQVYVGQDGRTAWWEELLDTWMGTARGSGIAVLTDDGWKIKHFNLAVMVPNEKMDKFRRLVKAKKKRGQ